MFTFIRRSIQAKILITMLLVILIPATIITSYNVYRSRQTLTEVIRLNQEQLVQAKVVDVEQQLVAPTNDLISLSQSLGIRVYVEEAAASASANVNIGTVETTLVDFLGRFGDAYNSICLLDRLGFEIVCADRVDGTVVLRDQSLLQDRVEADYFVDAIGQTGHLPGRQAPVAISDIRLNESSSPEPVLYYSTLLQTNTGIIGGVIVIEESLQPLFETIRANTEFEEIYLVDQAGVYWMHPDATALYDASTTLFDTRPADSQLITSEELGVVFGTTDEPQNLMTFSRIRPEGEAIRWYVIYEQPLRTVLGTVNRTDYVILSIMLVSVVLSSMLAVGLTRGTVASISQLADATTRFVQNPNAPLDLNIRNRDEIGKLASSFDSMTEQIRESINTLEERVQERTRDLEIAKVEAERANDAKSAFLANTSHELRTPLNAILNFTGFVARGKHGPVTEEQQEVLDRVRKSGRHLLNMINDLLDMSKIASGSLEVYKSDVDLNEEIEEVIKIAEALNETDNVEIITKIEPDLPTLYGDGIRIRQIMINMVSNACKFTEDGHVRLSASYTNTKFLFSVEDTGAGIAAEDADNVFQAFQQTASGRHKGKGTGLGMPISQNLAEAHGGRLWFDSTPGEGTTFYLELPINTEEAATVNPMVATVS